jgi:hypothetical protein
MSPALLEPALGLTLSLCTEGDALVHQTQLPRLAAAPWVLANASHAHTVVEVFRMAAKKALAAGLPLPEPSYLQAALVLAEPHSASEAEGGKGAAVATQTLRLLSLYVGTVGAQGFDFTHGRRLALHWAKQHAGDSKVVIRAGSLLLAAAVGADGTVRFAEDTSGSALLGILSSGPRCAGA